MLLTSKLITDQERSLKNNPWKEYGDLFLNAVLDKNQFRCFMADFDSFWAFRGTSRPQISRPVAPLKSAQSCASLQHNLKFWVTRVIFDLLNMTP